jgi:predicted phosphoribosyltransferase
MGNLRIVSDRTVIFQDRQQAGRQLGRALALYRDNHPVVLGIPRGGILVAREIARFLDAELDIILSRKLRTPRQEELAMGSIAEDGKTFLNKDVVNNLGINEASIKQETEAQMAEITRRSSSIRRVRPRVPLIGRTVIVVDDGVATGATIQAALWTAHQENPEYLIAAVPVGPPVTVRQLAKEVNEMVCLIAPISFTAVGQFYQHFDQLGDTEMLQILDTEQKRRQLPQ